MGGKIECYIDIASYYSYLAFVHLEQNHELLRQSGVTVDIHPFLIGAISVGSGNRPPWVVKAKARYLKHYDTKRASGALGVKNLSAPDDLMVAGKTIMPMRALIYIKANFPIEVFNAALSYLFHAFWTLHKVPNSAPILTEVLSEIPADFQLDCLKPFNRPTAARVVSSKSLFTREQVARIVEATGKDELKAALKARVDEALARGSFGAPWIWLTDAQGRTEPVFGNDRWDCVYEFLQVPYQKLQLLPPPQKAKL
ncbi:thioredoxin-like protein [Xylaria intraflava]|nr:thioredoxin-like protein [Xylaria intraflava]